MTFLLVKITTCKSYSNPESTFITLIQLSSEVFVINIHTTEAVHLGYELAFVILGICWFDMEIRKMPV